MRRVVGIALAAVLLVSPAGFAAEDDREQARQTQTYESPLLSLLLLPVTLLIRMASVLGPDDSAKTARDGASSDTTSK